MELLTKELVARTATGIKLKDITEGKVLSVKWEPNLKYAWDNGPAIGRYLSELKQGKIIARKCHKCHRIMLPPRMFCELCWRPTDEWVYVKDTGIVNTWVVSYVDWKATRLDIKGGVRPYTPAIIEIDGASKGMGILHHLNEVDPWKIHRDMKVKAVWEMPGKRIGAITDIKYFKPI
ncbi:MAG: Zn-ribbon domain-containing OB-fold protein [Planctomycetota bacterium]|nr:Zn-ribbon domain-containing OB-fold protein [Planctomycetota bacterium]MDI6788620.1 Zn-ribbon domain-containing OB-fold protein [Planctomycetota bacterium]